MTISFQKAQSRSSRVFLGRTMVGGNSRVLEGGRAGGQEPGICTGIRNFAALQTLLESRGWTQSGLRARTPLFTHPQDPGGDFEAEKSLVS